jgi:predicted ATPase
MDKLKLTIDGYKCFEKKSEFNLNNITLLTGANSSGKSSVIQSLLLAKIISEANVEDINLGIVPIYLMNKKYSLELGDYDDIINRQTKTGDIEFSLSGIEYCIKGDYNDDVVKNTVVFSVPSDKKTKLKNFFSNGFTYLCAERMAPHYEYLESDFNEICDCHGSNVGDVFSRYQGENIIDARSLSFGKNAKLLMQLDEWCNYIFPGIAVRVEKTGSQMYKLKIRNDVAPNVGFGITYALPILVSGLTVPNDGILIVENPEAHLHAKAQSNMGYFLARMAAAGVRVIIETHSEHIINGIRRMIVEGKTDMSHENLTIYFFQNKDGERNIMEISMDENGNLSAFPEDFFDQVRQDTLAMLRINRKKKEQTNGER